MSSDSNEMQILIIDDNSSLIRVFTKLLEIKGFLVTSETTFKKGLHRLKNDRFQAVFVDAPLDGHDEKQILTLLFENKIFSKTSVFLFSSVEFHDSELIQWKTNGLYSYLQKPIRRSRIIEELEILRSKFKIKPTPETPDSISDNEDPTDEQFEKLNQLEKQIHELETKNSSDKQEPVYDKTPDDSSPETPDSISDNEDPTDEQFEKLNQLEKQIHELETKNSSDKQEPVYDKTPADSSPETPDSISGDEDPTDEQFEKLNQLEKQIHELETYSKIKSKSIPGKLLLQNVIDSLKSSKINFGSSILSKNKKPLSLTLKEKIQKEMQKTLHDLSTLKKELELYDDKSNTSSVSSASKRKLKKSATRTTTTTASKRKLKKSSSKK